MSYGVPGFDGALAACLAAGHAGAASRSPRLLLTAVVTLGCLRVNEVARLQVCYLWFNYLMSYGVPGFEGTCSVHLNRRKNVTQRKGHYPPLAARGIRSWTWRHSCAAGWSSRGLQCIRHARERERRRAELACRRRPCTRQKASDRCCLAVMQAGGDSSLFSGTSARRVTSTAIEARMDEATLYLQSGHGAALPAPAYMWIAFPARFLEMFEAFGL